ncbi:hypothetical protein Emag_006902 [Eimeria magna]
MAGLRRGPSALETDRVWGLRRRGAYRQTWPRRQSRKETRGGWPGEATPIGSANTAANGRACSSSSSSSSGSSSGISSSGPCRNASSNSNQCSDSSSSSSVREASSAAEDPAAAEGQRQQRMHRE